MEQFIRDITSGSGFVALEYRRYTTTELYTRYKDFTSDANYQPMALARFGTRLNALSKSPDYPFIDSRVHGYRMRELKHPRVG